MPVRWPLLCVHVLGVLTEDGFVPDFRESDVSGCDRRIGSASFSIGIANLRLAIGALWKNQGEILAYAPVVPEQVNGSISTSLHRERRGRGMH